MLSTLYFLPLANCKDKIGKRIASLTGRFSRLRGEGGEGGAGNAIMIWHGRGSQPHRQISTAVCSSSSDFIKSSKNSSINGRMMIDGRYHKDTMMLIKRFESNTAKESEKNKGIVEKGGELSRKDKALLKAAYKGDSSYVSILLAEGADINAKSTDGSNALILAANEGHLSCVSLLLEAGANVNARNHDGLTVLMAASVNKHHSCVSLLLGAGADINAKNNNEFTSLMLASRDGRLSCVSMLLEHGADVNVKMNPNEYLDEGGTALMLACQYDDNLSCVSMLLDYGADIDAKNIYGGCTALMIASIYDNPLCVSLLLDRGADINAKSDVDDEMGADTALMFASGAGNLSCVSTLLAHGADVNYVNREGYTALRWAVVGGHRDVAEILKIHGAVLDP